MPDVGITYCVNCRWCRPKVEVQRWRRIFGVRLSLNTPPPPDYTYAKCWHPNAERPSVAKIRSFVQPSAYVEPPIDHLYCQFKNTVGHCPDYEAKEKPL